MIQSAAEIIQQNSLVNQANGGNLPQRIVSAIKTAAAQTGVDFSYLLKKAAQESSLDPNAQASSSSATGLYQFTQQTWLSMVKNYGGKYGLGTYADHITMDSNGIAHISDPTWRQAILNLRKDPVASAEMAGELDKQNQNSLQANVGGKIGATELYLAHFLGAGGASDFISEMRANPKQSAATVLPDAAAANPNVFYAKDGTPRSLQQIYQHFAQKFDTAAPTTLVASAAPSATTQIASSPKRTAPITVADAGSYVVTPAIGKIFGTNTLSTATGNLKIEGPSLFATMMLSQGNDDLSRLSSANTDTQHKKTPYDLASLAALG